MPDLLPDITDKERLLILEALPTMFELELLLARLADRQLYPEDAPLSFRIGSPDEGKGCASSVELYYDEELETWAMRLSAMMKRGANYTEETYESFIDRPPAYFCDDCGGYLRFECEHR